MELLYELIHSLTRSEKRHFKLSHQHPERDQQYLKLFDFLDQQDAFDQGKLKRWSKQYFSDNQLAVVKNQLRHLIYQDLRNFHSGSKKAVVKDILRNIEILFNKELYRHCKKELHRAQQIASDYELYLDLLEIHNWERRLHQNEFPQDHEGLQQIVIKQAQCLDLLINKQDYHQLIIDVARDFGTGSPRKAEKEYLLEDPENAQSMEARVMHFNALYFRKIQQGQSLEGKVCIEELIDQLDRQPGFISEDPGLYISTINNLISFCIFNKSYEEARQHIAKVKAFVDSLKAISENRNVLRQVLRTLNMELEIIRTHLHELNEEAFHSIESFVGRYEFKMPKEYVISFWFQLANIHFMRKEYKQSLQWINQLLNTSRLKQVRRDIQGFARILNLMVHLEQQNFFVMRYFVDSTRRFLKKQKGIEPYEKVMLQFFSRIGQTPVLQHTSLYQKLYEQLFPEAGESLISAEVLDYIDFRKWLQDKQSH